MDAGGETLRANDSGHQHEAVMALPDHLRDALWRIDSARLEPAEAAGAIVCGMGGSAIGGDLAAAALGDRCTRPLFTVRGYELPSWATPEWTVLCSSYSGDTEETLACLDAAGALGARRIVVTTGGRLAEVARRERLPVIGLPAALEPRAAVGYMFATAAEVAALARAGPAIHTEIDTTAARLEAQRETLREQAADLAEAVHGTVPVIYGSDLTAAAALRWKTQINENAKSPAFWGTLPEADHNELAGWEGAGETKLSAIFLVDSDQHPRERSRFELTGKLLSETAAEVVRVETEGHTRTERLLWTVMLGDLLSLALAARRGVDPTPVQWIDRLKSELGAP